MNQHLLDKHSLSLPVQPGNPVCWPFLSQQQVLCAVLHSMDHERYKFNNDNTHGEKKVKYDFSSKPVNF